MTIDERIEKLTERHEALAQSVELLSADVGQQSQNLDKLVGTMSDLSQVAHPHERRITNLEGGR